jgi:parallel beta-helix repeat protein
MRNTADVTLILTGLLTLGVFCIQPIKAEYQGSITINADGSISPSTAPIQQTSNIYSLTSDIVGSITVHTSNIILDGNGHTVSGVSLQGTLNVTVKNFVVTSQGGRIGISLNDASNNLIANNTVSGFWSIQALNAITFAGIYVMGGNSNVIKQNNLLNNLDGMEFINTSYNLIVQNNVKGSQVWSPYITGICFCGASDNTIYRNNFVDNFYQVYSDSINAWDDGYLGNYWSDYQTKYPSAVQIGDSGVYNVPYAIDAQNIDRYPLTQPFNSEFYAPKIPPKISLLSPVNQEFNESSVPLSFTVDKQAVWIGYSLDGQDNVTISGNTTIAGLLSGLHNVTVYAEDEFENSGASETISFSVAELPFPTALVIVAFIASAVAVSAALLVYFKKRRATNLKRNLSPN